MDIYIKSFNRPYLLHRTLLSICYFLKNFDGKIIVLDDGTPQRYLNKILELFPDIQIAKSPFYSQKSKEILENRIPPKKIPADFWRNQIAKGTEQIILLEDDMWFSRPIDFPAFREKAVSENMDMIKFFWLKNNDLLSERIVSKNEFFSVVLPKLLVKNATLFNMIFRTNKLKFGSLASRFVKIDKEILKYYHLYTVAGGVFSKKYYLTCWNLNQEKVDEMVQIHQLLKSKIPMNVGNTNIEILKATYKTTASLISKESLDFEINIFEINRILNDAWLEGKSYKIDDFGEDLPTEWIKSCFEKNDSPTKTTFEDWSKWYEIFKKSYERMGCSL